MEEKNNQTITTDVSAEKPTEPQAPAATAPNTVAQEVTSTSAPTPRYTDKELEERIASVKGGYEGTIKQLKADAKKAREEIEAVRDAAREETFAKIIADAETSGGDVNKAKALVEREREHVKRERALAEREERINAQLAIVNEAGKTKKAHDLAKELALAPDVIDVLLKEETPEAMETKALRLALQKVTADGQPPMRTDSPITSPKGTKDLSKMSDAERLGWALEQVGKT